MKIDAYDYDALTEAAGRKTLDLLEEAALQLGLPNPRTSWTAVPALLSVASTIAALNLRARAQAAGRSLSLDEATSSLLAPASAGASAKQRACGPRVNLKRWRQNVRNK